MRLFTGHPAANSGVVVAEFDANGAAALHHSARESFPAEPRFLDKLHQLPIRLLGLASHTPESGTGIGSLATIAAVRTPPVRTPA